jgi:hypothetical protein
VSILHLGGWTLRILVGLLATTIDILESGEIFPGELENILRRGEEYFLNKFWGIFSRELRIFPREVRTFPRYSR